MAPRRCEKIDFTDFAIMSFQWVTSCGRKGTWNLFPPGGVEQLKRSLLDRAFSGAH